MGTANVYVASCLFHCCMLSCRRFKCRQSNSAQGIHVVGVTRTTSTGIAVATADLIHLCITTFLRDISTMKLLDPATVKLEFYCPTCQNEIGLVIPNYEGVPQREAIEILRLTRWRSGKLMLDCINDDCPGGEEMRRH